MSVLETNPVEYSITFNEDRDVIAANRDAAMGRVLHVFDRHWHGIRAATGCLPGGKLAISHKTGLVGDELRHIEGLIFKCGFEAVCFQGYSETADKLAEVLHDAFGSDLRQYAVTHVTTSQFEHAFEMHMLKRIYDKVQRGILRRAGSVKPDFQHFHELAWPKCVLNLPPNLERMRLALPEREPETVFIPVENTWRKNLYTQVIAAQGSDMVSSIIVVNWPTHLDGLLPLGKLRMIRFQALSGLLAHMRLSQAVCNLSFSECQPMTQLESLAVGTPALVNKLRLPGFSDHPLSQLTEVDVMDGPGYLREKLETVLGEWRRDPKGLGEMIADFLQLRIKAGIQSYHEFLEL